MARASQIPVATQSAKVMSGVDNAVAGGDIAAMDTEEPEKIAGAYPEPEEGGQDDDDYERLHQQIADRQALLDSQSKVIDDFLKEMKSIEGWKEMIMDKMATLIKNNEELQRRLAETETTLNEKNMLLDLILNGGEKNNPKVPESLQSSSTPPSSTIEDTLAVTSSENPSQLEETSQQMQPSTPESKADEQPHPVKPPSKSSMKKAANNLRDLKKEHGIDGLKIMDDLLLEVEERYPELNNDSRITVELKENRFKDDTTHRYVAIMMVYPGTLQMLQDAYQAAIAGDEKVEEEDMMLKTENVPENKGDLLYTSLEHTDEREEEVLVEFEAPVPEDHQIVPDHVGESTIEAIDVQISDIADTLEIDSNKPLKWWIFLFIGIFMFGSPLFLGTFNTPLHATSNGIIHEMLDEPHLNWNTCTNDSSDIPEFPRVPLHVPVSYPDEAPKPISYKKIFSTILSNVASATRECVPAITLKNARFGVIGTAFSIEYATPLDRTSSHPKVMKSVRFGAIGAAWLGEWIWG